MVFSIFALLAAAVVGFLVGVLVGRNNKALVEKYVAEHQPTWDKVIKEIEDLKDRIPK